MGKTKDINELKKEYIDKTFNRLMILDIYRNEKSLLMCKCKCECGNIKDIQMRYVLSSHTTSCGCYNKSEEKRNKVKLFWENNPDKAKERGLKTSAYYKNNPEKTKERNKHVSESNKQYCRSNPDIIENRRQQHLNTIIQKRNIDFIELYKDYIHPDDYKLLQHSNMKSIRSKCPVCNNYEYHLFGNIFSYNNQGLKSNRSLPLCHDCLNKLTTSSYETEIEDFIKSFYNGEIVRNTRNIISPQELDIYIPEKKIAIEFNGDY